MTVNNSSNSSLKKKRYEGKSEKKGEIGIMSLVSWLYKLARKANDFETIASGKPVKIARRGKNKLIGHKIWPRINKFPF